MMSPESMKKTGLQFPRQDSLATSAMHEQIKGEVFDEVMHLVAKALPIQSVENRVACPVSNGTSSTGLSAFPKSQ